MATNVIAADTGVLNTQLFYEQLDRLMGASIGVIAIRTREMSRGKLLLHQWASMRGMDFNVWTAIDGFWQYRQLPVVDEDGGAEVAVEQADMQTYLNPHQKVPGTEDIIAGLSLYKRRMDEKLTERTMFCGVFMGVIDDWLKHEIVQQHIRDHVQRAYQNNDRVILMLTPGTTIPDAIVGDVELIDLPTPSFAELQEALSEMEGEIPDEFGFEMTDDDRVNIVQNGMGMTQQEFENAFSLAIVDTSAKLESLDETDEYEVTAHDFVKVVRGRKLEILKQTKILELMPEGNIADVGGLDLLKDDLALQREAFSAEARAFGIRSPKGFLVVGPPGTGKTLIAKASSNVLGIPLIKFDISAVFNSLVGSSEARMRMCLKMLEDMAPCVAFFDEIDKGIGNGGSGGGDSGVSARIFGTLLSWMQDKQDKDIPVLVIASANNILGIPPELLRKGRFDDIWSVSFPSAVERAAIFKIHIEKRGHTLTADEYKVLAKMSDNFVGSEIEAVVEAALRIDFNKKHKTLQVDTLKDRVDALVPQAKAFPEKIAAMKQWCEQNARPSSSGASFDIEQSDAHHVRPTIQRKTGGLKIKPRRSTGN